MKISSKPAFPSTGQILMSDLGISTRQYYAAKAMQAWITSLALRHDEQGYTDRGNINEATILSFATADAMIAFEEEETKNGK